ncbi:MAG: STAS domain-containing protein [bacterium]
MATLLNIAVKELSGGICHIALEGVLNLDTTPKLAEILNEQIERGRYKFVVNFGKLEYISSSGVGCFVDTLSRIDPKGGGISFYNLPVSVARVFELLDFIDVFGNFKTMREAIEALGG